MPLILVIGLPSTGKTFIAESLSKSLPEEPVCLSTDIIRRKLFNFSEHRYSSFDTDIYTQENRNLVYNALYYFTDILLSKGHIIIINGTFYSEATRQPFYEMCKRLNQKLIIIQTTCSDVTVKQRINKRKQHGKNVSDADFSIYQEFKKIFEPLTVNHLIVDTDKDISQNLREVENYLETYEII
jgi:predicted kinase